MQHTHSTLPIVTLGTIRPEDSGISALNCTAKPKSLAVWSCLGIDNPPCPITPILTLSYVHHSSHQRFHRITMSLKRPFVPKSDVK